MAAEAGPGELDRDRPRPSAGRAAHLRGDLCGCWRPTVAEVYRLAGEDSHHREL